MHQEEVSYWLAGALLRRMTVTTDNGVRQVGENRIQQFVAREAIVSTGKIPCGDHDDSPLILTNLFQIGGEPAHSRIGLQAMESQKAIGSRVYQGST